MLRIRDPVTFCPLDRGSGMNNQIIFPIAQKPFIGVKILNSLVRIRDPGWKKSGILDGKNSDPGSGINIPDPQHGLGLSVLSVGNGIRSENIPENQCGGSGMFIPDPKTAMKDIGEKNWLSYLSLGVINFTKLNYFIFEMSKKKIWANFQRIIELFTQKIVSKLLFILTANEHILTHFGAGPFVGVPNPASN
jgi:hypothetical protein